MLRRRSPVLASVAGLIAAVGVGSAAFLALVADDAPAAPAAIAFARGEGLNPAIYAMAADGTDARELVSYGSQPRWSPDGRRLAFVVHSPPEDEPPPDGWRIAERQPNVFRLDDVTAGLRIVPFATPIARR